jgi:hypothetical protein
MVSFRQSLVGRTRELYNDYDFSHVMKPEKSVNHLSVTCGGESYNSESYNGGSTVILCIFRMMEKSCAFDLFQGYLSSLTQKTQQQTKSVNYEAYGENISISSGADASMTPRMRKTPSPTVGAGSKFLKKKAQPAAEPPTPAKKATGGYGVKARGGKAGMDDIDDDDDDDDIPEVRRSYGASAGPKFGISASATGSGKRGGAQFSSALQKAAALAQKITSRSAGSAPASNRKTRSRLDSDTDESISPGPGSRKRGGGGRRSRPGSASDTSIGRDGSKFLKKKGPAAAEVVEVAKPQAGRQSPARPSSRERASSQTPGMALYDV